MPKVARELTAVQVKRLAQKKGFHAVGGVAGLYLNVSNTLATGRARQDAGFLRDAYLTRSNVNAHG